MPIPPDYQSDPPRVPGRPIILKAPTISIESAETVLALTLSGLFCLAGLTYKVTAPFMAEEYYQRLSQEGGDLLQQGLALGFGAGGIAGAGTALNGAFSRRRREDDDPHPPI